MCDLESRLVRIENMVSRIHLGTEKAPPRPDIHWSEGAHYASEGCCRFAVYVRKLPTTPSARWNRLEGGGSW